MSGTGCDRQTVHPISFLIVLFKSPPLSRCGHWLVSQMEMRNKSHGYVGHSPILLFSTVTSLQHPSAYCFFLCLSALPPLVQFCTHSPRLHSPPLAPADIQAAFFFPTHTLSLQPIPLITVNESFICNQRASPLAGRVPLPLAKHRHRARHADSTRFGCVDGTFCVGAVSKSRSFSTHDYKYFFFA